MTSQNAPTSIGSNLLVLTVGLLAGLGLAELVVRSLPEPVIGFHYENGHFSRPKEFEPDRSRNSLGYHDVEHGASEPAVRRVILVGDSFVEARSVPVAATVGQRLESHLNASGVGRWEVFSVGKVGWGQWEQQRALKQVLPLIRPELVVTLMQSFNDVRDNLRGLDREAEAQQLDRQLTSALRPGYIWMDAGEAPWLLLPGSALNRLVSHRVAMASVNEGAPIPTDYLVYSTTVGRRWQRAWRRTKRLLESTEATVSASGAVWALATATTAHGVLGAETGLARLLELYPAMRDGQWDLDMPDRKVGEIAARLGVQFLALEPAFREAQASGRRLHWRYDGHWNEEGNDLAGELLAAFVLDLSEGAPRSAREGQSAEMLEGSS